MLKCMRLALVALTVSAVLGLGTGSALGQLEVSATRIRATATGLTFGSSEAPEFSIVCDVTLGMTLNSRRIPITPLTVAGGVTEASANEAGCRGGRARMLTEGLPWTVRLVSFREGLIRLQTDRMSALITDSTGFSRCSYSGNEQVTNVNDPITALRADERVSLGLVRSLAGSIFCPRTGFIRGELRPTTEVAYTESEARGQPLQPNAERLVFRRMRIEQTVIFRNTNWIWDVNVDNKGILGANRFRTLLNGAEECLARRRIERTCTDKIQLDREEEAMVGTYVVTLLGQTMGSVQLVE